MTKAARHRRANGLSQSTDLREAPFSHRSVHDASTRHRWREDLEDVLDAGEIEFDAERDVWRLPT